MVAVANGMEQSQIVDGSGFKTTHFKHSYPIPAYLVAIAVTDYEIYEQVAGTAPHTFPIINYLYPENYQSAVSQLAVTLPIMNLFENLFEPILFIPKNTVMHSLVGVEVWNIPQYHLWVVFRVV